MGLAQRLHATSGGQDTRTLVAQHAWAHQLVNPVDECALSVRVCMTSSSLKEVQAVAWLWQRARIRTSVHAAARSRSQVGGRAQWGTKDRAFGLSRLGPTIPNLPQTASLEDLGSGQAQAPRLRPNREAGKSQALLCKNLLDRQRVTRVLRTSSASCPKCPSPLQHRRSQ